MDITRIRRSGEKVAIGIQHGDDAATAEVTFKTKNPTPEFNAALDALKQFVPKLCKPMVNAEAFEKRGVVTGVTFSRKSEDDIGYVITSYAAVDGVNSPLNIPTPFLERAADGSGEFKYREDLFNALDALEQQAWILVRSRRPSIDLFASENGRRPAPEPTPIEAEAAAAERQQRVREAFVAALPKRPGKPLKLDSDDTLALYIAEAWEDRKTDFEGHEYAGLVRVNDVWCYLGSGPEPAFYFDVAAPTEFDPASATPDVAGEQLVAWAREAWGLVREPVTA